MYFFCCWWTFGLFITPPLGDDRVRVRLGTALPETFLHMSLVYMSKSFSSYMADSRLACLNGMFMFNARLFAKGFTPSIAISVGWMRITDAPRSR